MDCDALRDDQWERIKGFVPGGAKDKRGPHTDNRKFLDALLRKARSGGRWRDLPERLGDYRSVLTSFLTTGMADLSNRLQMEPGSRLPR